LVHEKNCPLWVGRWEPYFAYKMYGALRDLQHLQNSAPLICWFSRRNCTEFYAFASLRPPFCWFSRRNCTEFYAFSKLSMRTRCT